MRTRCGTLAMIRRMRRTQAGRSHPQPGIFPQMSEEDLNLISAAGWATNPDDPEGDTNVVTIAVLVVHGGAAGPGHSAMFIGPRGRGFWPKQMKTFDFGPADSKDISQGLASVPGAPYWAALAAAIRGSTGLSPNDKIAD
jgi:hypothetical protein